MLEIKICLGQNFAITSNLRQPLWETLRSSLDAEVALANQEIAKDFLDLWQTETCPKLKEFFAAQYRRVVGVDPSHHEEFRKALEQIRKDGSVRVADLVASFHRRFQANGFSGA